MTSAVSLRPLSSSELDMIAGAGWVEPPKPISVAGVDTTKIQQAAERQRNTYTVVNGVLQNGFGIPIYFG